MSETGAEPVKRRLAAILAADAVGYSARMSEDEERTLRTLQGHRVVIDSLIAARDGRIVGTAGDGVLAEFPSSVEAVRCAVEIQEALATRNDGLPEPERLQFRIGINLGDVIVKGSDILGDGVNVAARLESIADPGGVCIASSVFDQISGKLNLGFAEMGEQSLKNIVHPVRTYRFSGAAVPDRAVSHTPPAPRKADRRRSNVWIVATVTAVLAVIAAGAYTLGVFRRATPESATGADRAAAANGTDRSPAAAPSEETRLKLQIAEAERAKAEADLARTRVEARSQRAAPVAGAAASPARASAGPTHQLSALSGTAELRCKGAADVQARQGVAKLIDGEVTVEFGVPGRPGYATGHGRPSADGTLLLQTSFAGRGGRQGVVAYEGRLLNGAGTLMGRAGNCSLELQMR